MTNNTETSKETDTVDKTQGGRKGFTSPLERARSGKIGGGGSGGNPPIEGGTDTTTSERKDDVVTEEEADTTKKKREETHFRQTVWMPKPLNRRLKIHAATKDEDVSGIINKLVEAYLNREEG